MFHIMFEDNSSSPPPERVEGTSAMEAADLRYLDPKTLRLFRRGAFLGAELEDECCYLQVQIFRAFPLSEPDRYLSVRDGSGKEIGLLIDPHDLDADGQRLVKEELERRYMVPLIKRLNGLKERFGTLDWDVETDRGPRKFTTRNPRENSVMLSTSRFLVTDVDGNRYEIGDLVSLDPTGLLMRHL